MIVALTILSSLVILGIAARNIFLARRCRELRKELAAEKARKSLRGGIVHVPSVFPSNPHWESAPGAWCDGCGEVYKGD